jgi:hypothetical protein
MVDKDKIQQTLKKYFAYHGKVDIDDSGVVSTTGGVQFLGGQKKLPVRFGEVGSTFKANQRKLNTLVGSPHTVGGQFICWGNPITTLQGGPKQVGGAVYARDCQLTNLEGAPECPSLFVQNNPLKNLEGMPENLQVFGFTFDPNLPLLRAIQAQEISMYTTEGGAVWQTPLALKCYKILEKYAGKGMGLALNCGVELKDAGLTGNAAW